MKVFVQIVLITCLILLTSAQTHYRNKGKSSKQESAGQGRTLGLIQPLLNLGLSSIARPFVGYDGPIVAPAAYRPSSTSGTGQSDLYYGNYGYGNYGGYRPNYYNGYNYYGGYPLYRPHYSGYHNPFYGGYRPQLYPGQYGGYPQYNGFGSQRPFYNNARPRRIAQRPVAGQPSTTYPSTATTLPVSGMTKPTVNGSQAAQIANLLGQLLGQQLRPLLNQGAASPAHDDLAYASSSAEGKRYRGRYYQT